ncbi:AAA family ATPase [Nocardioides pyridinolyticus]
MAEDLVGLAEVADMARVSRTVASNWRARDSRFPTPVADLRSGPVFDRDAIEKYLRRRGSPMAHIISTINLKGGVGKTTTTVGLAEFLSAEFHKKVLVIDLDPQTNATTVLIGEDRWRELNDAGNTLVTLFTDALRGEDDEPRFDLTATLQKKVSPVSEVRSVDLLPSSLDLIDVQDRLASMPSGRFYSNNPTDLLRRAVKPILDDYDYVLVDCPPNLGIVTLNGLRISDGYIIPTIPDVLSTYGIPQIQSRVKAFADNLGEDIQELGIVVTKYRAASTVHNTTIRRLEDDENLPVVFETWVPEGNAIAASAEFSPMSTLRQKYAYQGGYEVFRALAKEFIAAAEEIA